MSIDKLVRASLFKMTIYEKRGGRGYGGTVGWASEPAWAIYEATRAGNPFQPERLRAQPWHGRSFFYRTTAEASLTVKNNAANPVSNTPLSNPTEIVCNRPNSARNGFPAAVASIDPICTLSTAIRGLTATCEITVSTIINVTHKAAGATKAVKLRIRKSRTNKITPPQTIPIQCIRPSEYPTIAPA